MHDALASPGAAIGRAYREPSVWRMAGYLARTVPQWPPLEDTGVFAAGR
jgi:hypothetical protein